jgi:sugar phosphate isomerase/epimerase
MKLALSNLAWDFDENEKIFSDLKTLEINNIEGVLTKVSSWENLNEEKIHSFKKLLQQNGLKIFSLQSIFFGVACEGLHDSKIVIPHIEKLISYSKILGVEILVLGSPNLRKKVEGLEQKLKETFETIDSILFNSNIKICIEPNTKSYGGEYFHDLDEITEFIKKNNFLNVKTMVDTHNLLLENLDPSLEIEKHINYVEHIHVSEPKLLPLHDFELHKKFSETLKKLNYNKVITYEVAKHNNLIDSLKNFISFYQT